MNTGERNVRLLVIALNLFIFGCGVGQLLEPTLTPTVIPTSTSTSIPSTSVPVPSSPTPTPEFGVQISIPRAHFTSMSVYETGNKIFVADDNSESLIVLDGVTNQIVTTIPSVGGAIFDMAVNETYGKVYAASDRACCTSGITPGNGLISIIDANTNQIITQIDPGPQTNISSDFLLGNDEVHDKIYLTFSSGVGVIDAATDSFTLIPKAGAPFSYLEKIGINTVTNEIFLPTLGSRLTVIDGKTLSVQTVPYPEGSDQALDVAINELENKVYITMIRIPGQDRMGILVLDRDTGEHKFVGADDLEPLAFNNASNKLFTGVQIGRYPAIIDGATDEITYMDQSTSAIGAIAVRESTDHAYIVSTQFTAIMSGSTKDIFQIIPSNVPRRGGVVFSLVAINQDTGQVYVVNDGDAGKIMVFQD